MRSVVSAVARFVSCLLAALTLWAGARGTAAAFFEARTISGVVRLIRTHEDALARGLQARQSAITLDEFEVVSKAIAQDGRIVSLVYLNRYGEVRWFRDPDPLRGGCRLFEEFRPAEEPPSRALLEAYRTRKMALSRKLRGRFVEVAWPIVRGEVLLGVLDAHAEVGTGKTDWPRGQSAALK